MNALKATSVTPQATNPAEGVPVTLPLRAVWDLLSRDSGAGVMVCDTSGRIAYANERFARYLNKPGASAIVGKLFSEIYPESAGAERLDVVRRAVHERRPIILESVWNGVAYQTVIRPLATLGGDATMAICVTRHQPRPNSDDLPTDVERVQTRVNNLGPLSSLTMRELELLALIGEGLSSHDIAKKISRSIKTVEAHRASLGKKLGVASRVALAKIAAECNLHFDHLQSRQVVRGRLAERSQQPSGN